MNFTVGSVGSYANDFDETIGNIAYWDREIAAHPDLLMKITRGAQIDEAKRAGRLGIIYGFQDTTMYGENLDRFDEFHNFGVRIVQLTYNRRNLMMRIFGSHTSTMMCVRFQNQSVAPSTPCQRSTRSCATNSDLRGQRASLKPLPCGSCCLL